MDIRISTSEPFTAWIERPRQIAAAAVTSGVTLATEGAKTELRQAIEAAGLGRRLANAVASAVYPRGKDSLGAAGSVYGRGASADRVLDAFANGVVIRSAHGFFLPIPTEAAGKYGDGRQRITPGLWERMHGQRLRYVYVSPRLSMLVADGVRLTSKGRALPSRGRKGREQNDVVIFILVPQVRLPKKFDADSIVGRWADRVVDLIEKSLPTDI